MRFRGSRIDLQAVEQIRVLPPCDRPEVEPESIEKDTRGRHEGLPRPRGLQIHSDSSCPVWGGVAPHNVRKTSLRREAIAAADGPAEVDTLVAGCARRAMPKTPNHTYPWQRPGANPRCMMREITTEAAPLGDWIVPVRIATNAITPSYFRVLTSNDTRALGA